MKTELIAALKRYRAFDLQERDMVTKTIEYLKSTDDYLGKVNPKGHITGSAWIVNKTRDKVLLTHHLKLNIWVQLGGHTELDESVESSAYREGIEESGLEYLTLVEEGIYDVDVHLIPKRKSEQAHYHYDIRFIYEADDRGPLKVSDESHDLKWVPVNKIEEYTKERSVIRMIEKMG
ncbi:NUDIX domain-containing protein [Acidaminobacter sp. JC074]|uniref:NUDIX hydrolase n=1 Tax=Acidaminobacter sp. JC074 TaxID=2530199 RepID=UPI001F0F74AE|nr:NUDIX hydrolase [Acidaminobacter sp. JC074]MCH4888041.1 NUDIX domain-containing protein [Acidaminobacter sp. JC074]